MAFYHIQYEVSKMLVNLFSKQEDEYSRYWVSVSTEKADRNGKGTGEYINASITVRLSKAAAEVFDDISVKTKTKGITQARVLLKDYWFKAGETKDGETYVYLFVNAMKEAPSN